MKKPKRTGRPPKVTLDAVEVISKCIAIGLTEEQACLYAEVNHSSLRTARHRRPEFETAIKRAQATFLFDALVQIRAGAAGWQGAAWILERRHKPQFNRTEGVALNTPEGGAVLTEQQIDALSKIAKELFVRPTTNQKG